MSKLADAGEKRTTSPGSAICLAALTHCGTSLSLSILMLSEKPSQSRSSRSIASAVSPQSRTALTLLFMISGASGA